MSVRLVRGTVLLLLLLTLLLAAGCGGSIYRVKPAVEAPAGEGRSATAGGFSVRAVPLLADEESQELFEANLPLAGLLPVRFELSNESGQPLSFKRVRFRLRDADGREWKVRSPKQVVSRILDANEIYLYNPNSRKRFEEGLAAHAFDVATPLAAAGRRQGLLFFQTPKKEQLTVRGRLVLAIEGLPQPVELALN
ncbi:MAG TPA: hypothetical protein VF723_08510 [Pyrinomonadaceae bacterium]|jgi:hypothetical protein